MIADAEIRNARGERLDTSFHAGRDGARDLVVVGHGVTANKDRPFLIALGNGLAAAGIACLRISFAGNGASEGRFEESTITKEVDDLGAVLDAAAADGWRTAYVGHSMGGAVGVLRASRDDRIETLVSLAGMVHTAEFAERKFGDLTPGTSFMWDKPECPLSFDYVDDMKAIGTVEPRAKNIRVPWLLVHGTADTVVLPQDAHDIAAAHARSGNEPPIELAELEGVDHVFSNAGTPVMVDVVVPWLTARFARAT